MTNVNSGESFLASTWSRGSLIIVHNRLMKAEPDSRIQNGVDVGFSIDALMSKTEPEGWDGVRNPVARNNMRTMREVNEYLPRYFPVVTLTPIPLGRQGLLLS